MLGALAKSGSRSDATLMGVVSACPRCSRVFCEEVLAALSKQVLSIGLELRSRVLKSVCDMQSDWWALSQQDSPEPSDKPAAAAPAAAPAAAADAAASSPAALPMQNGHTLQTPLSLDEAGQSGEWVPVETTGPKRPPPRYEHAVAVIGSSMYMVGGNCSMSPAPSLSSPCRPALLLQAQWPMLLQCKSPVSMQMSCMGVRPPLSHPCSTRSPTPTPTGPLAHANSGFAEQG